MPQMLTPRFLNTGSTQGLSALVIEDEAIIRKMLARWLSSAGFVCHTAANGQEALAVLDAQPVQVVISDICMPGISGLELLPQVRERSPYAAIIMLTALGDTTTAIQALTHGAGGYLIKPTTKDAVLEEVAGALARRELEIREHCRSQTLENALAMQEWEQECERQRAVRQLITASNFRDSETGAHVMRTGLFCEAMADAMGCPSDQVTSIRLAAPLHDIGKLGIPDAILLKPAALTDDEFSVMKTHTNIGGQLLGESSWPTMQLASEIALFHHEWWDGSGYPFGYRGQSIPLPARLVSIVDVYDALTHDRVYRLALDEQVALELMRQGKGKQFDPDLFDIFERNLPRLRDIAAAHPDQDALTSGDNFERLVGCSS